MNLVQIAQEVVKLFLVALMTYIILDTVLIVFWELGKK